MTDANSEQLFEALERRSEFISIIMSDSKFVVMDHKDVIGHGDTIHLALQDAASE